MGETFDMIAKTFFGLEDVLAAELDTLGAQDVRIGRRMASFRGDARMLARANVHCRVAVRILKPIHTFEAADEQALYRGISQIDWLAHLDADGSLAIDPVVHSPIFNNSLYAAQLAKDAIVDQIRAATGRRPAVNLVDPDLRINLHIDRERVTVYLDASGDSLHKRGYRTATGEAPINEVLAAGILRLSGWDENSPLSDFMCGSGTFLIEAALAARQIAPGLVRKQFGYMRWKDFCQETHSAILEEARQQVRPDLPFPIQGSDLDLKVISAARENARRAGVEADIQWSVENFESVAPPASAGTLVTNPPYDERMKTAQIAAVYQRIGDVLKQRWAGHTAFLFTGNLEAAKHIGLRAGAKIRLFNGPIECRLLKFTLFASTQTNAPLRQPDRRGHEQAAAFGNRLARMAKHWHRWARRQGITNYRIYDRDVPEVPLTIDWYEGHVLIAECQRPHSRTEIEQQAWFDQMAELASRTLDVPLERLTLNPRGRSAVAPRKDKPQPRVVEVHEAELRFEVRLGSGQETGFELDGRILRGRLRAEASGKRVLNLFARTGTNTAAVAAGGATSTTSVEASRASLDWAQRNLRVNGLLRPEHRLVCQDPLEFVQDLDPAGQEPFDLAVLQPSSFDGKRREGVWNVQDGHVDLLNRLLECMAIGGKIYFLTTFRRLALHESQIGNATVREITRQTVPPDFRNKKVHRCWTLVRTADGVARPVIEPSLL